MGTRHSSPVRGGGPLAQRVVEGHRPNSAALIGSCPSVRRSAPATSPCRGGMSASGRFQTILPCKGSSRETRVSLELAEGQTEGYPPLDSVTPLHHFVVPFGRVACLCRTLQGRNLQPLLVVSCQSRISSLRAERSNPLARDGLLRSARNDGDARFTDTVLHARFLIYPARWTSAFLRIAASASSVARSTRGRGLCVASPSPRRRMAGARH